MLAGLLADRTDTETWAGTGCASAEGLEAVDRLVQVDQRPIGRTPRSNLATYTGLFDVVRKLFAGTEETRARGSSSVLVGRWAASVGVSDPVIGP